LANRIDGSEIFEQLLECKIGIHLVYEIQKRYLQKWNWKSDDSFMVDRVVFVIELFVLKIHCSQTRNQIMHSLLIE
jgi:hypothetical protein